MPLPTVDPSALDVQPIDHTGLPERFLNPGELETIVALVRSVQPRVVAEFGCNVGRTAKAILANVPGIERYTGVDVPPEYVPAKRVQIGETDQNPGALVLGDPRFQLIVRAGGSLEISATDLGPCDAVFIDGDHGRVAVEHDTALALSVLRPGGIVVWHDYHDLGTVDVREVLDELQTDGAPIVHVAGTWLAYMYMQAKKNEASA